MTPYLGGGCSCTSNWWQLQLLTHNIEVTEIDKLMARNTRTQTWNWNERSWWINRTRQQLKWHQAGWEAKLLAAWWSNWWCIWLLMFNCVKNNFSCSGGKEAVVKDKRFERWSQTGNVPKFNPNKKTRTASRAVRKLPQWLQSAARMALTVGDLLQSRCLTITTTSVSCLGRLQFQQTYRYRRPPQSKHTAGGFSISH